MNALSMRLQLNTLEKNAQMLVQNELSTLLRIYKEFAQERHGTQQQQQQEQRRQEQSQDTMSAMAAAKADANVKLISDSSSSENSESAASPSASSSSGAISDNDMDDDKEDNDDDENDDDDDESGGSNESTNDFDNEASNGNESDSDTGRVRFTEVDLILGSILIQDMRMCQQDDSSLFLFLLPFVLSSSYFLPAYMLNNSELVYLIVSCVDSKQLKDLVAAIVSQDIVLLRQTENAPAKGSGKKASGTGSKKPSASKRQTKNSSTVTVKASGKTSSDLLANKKRKRNSGRF
jgi:hypothetical protein